MPVALEKHSKEHIVDLSAAVLAEALKLYTQDVTRFDADNRMFRHFSPADLKRMVGRDTDEELAEELLRHSYVSTCGCCKLSIHAYTEGEPEVYIYAYYRQPFHETQEWKEAE